MHLKIKWNIIRVGLYMYNTNLESNSMNFHKNIYTEVSAIESMLIHWIYPNLHIWNVYR